MAVTTKPLVDAKYAANSQTTQYTVPAGTFTIIDKATVTNIGASAAAISVNLIPSGGSAGNDNLIVDAKTIQVGETYNLPELVNQTLKAGDIISTLASAATTLTIRVSGREVT